MNVTTTAAKFLIGDRINQKTISNIVAGCKMRYNKQRKNVTFEQLNTEKLERLLVQDFVTSAENEANLDYIMAILRRIKEKEMSAEHQIDVNAAWKDFQENYQGYTAAFERSILCEK